MQGDLNKAHDLFAQSLTIYEERYTKHKEQDDKAGMATAQYKLAEVAADRGNTVLAQSLYDQSLGLFGQLGNDPSYERGAAEVNNGLGNLAFQQGNYSAAQDYFEDCLVIVTRIGSTNARAVLNNNIAMLCNVQKKPEQARNYYEENVGIFRALGPNHELAVSLNNLGLNYSGRGDFDQALSLFQECRDLFETLGDPNGVDSVSRDIGEVAIYQKEFVTASSLFTQSLKYNREKDNPENVAICLLNLGLIAIADPEKARATAQAHLTESLTIFQKIPSRRGIAFALEAFARLADGAERAAVLLGAAQAIRKNIGSHLTSTEQKDYDAVVAEVRSALGEAAFTAAWTQGSPMTDEEAITFAFTSDAC